MIFGSSSIEHALCVCLRLQHMKRRHAAGLNEPSIRVRKKLLPARNYHHLTPKSRRGKLHHGDSHRNLLLIDIERHIFWHQVFKIQTLEETVAMLIASVKAGRQCYFVFACFLARWSERSGQRLERAERWGGVDPPLALKIA